MADTAYDADHLRQAIAAKRGARRHPQQPVTRAQISARQASLRPAPSRGVLLLQAQAVPPRRNSLRKDRPKLPPEITAPSSLSQPSSYGCDKCPHCLALTGFAQLPHKSDGRRLAPPHRLRLDVPRGEEEWQGANQAVPTHERLGPDDREDLQDRWKPAIQLDEEPAIMLREPDATREPAPQDIQLMSKRRVLSLKPQLRLEWRGQDGQSEAEQPDHSASLGDSMTSSTRIRFSVHTGQYCRPNDSPVSLTRSFGLTTTPDFRLRFEFDFWREF